MAGATSKRSSSTSPAAKAAGATSSPRNDGIPPSRGRPAHDRARYRRRVLTRPRLGDGAALSLPPAHLLAAAARTRLLAGRPDDHLGVHERLSARQWPLVADRRLGRADRRGAALGRPFPRPARDLDLVPRRDVGAQPRPPLRQPAAPL